MFPNCIDRFGRQKKVTKQQQLNREKPGKNKQIETGSNSTYHEPLS